MDRRETDLVNHRVDQSRLEVTAEARDQPGAPNSALPQHEGPGRVWQASGDRLRPARARPEQKMRRLDTEHVEGEVGFGALGHQPHPVAHGDVLQSRVDVEGTLVRGGYSLCGRWTSTQTSRWSLEGKGQVPVRVDSGSLETGQKTAESRMR